MGIAFERVEEGFETALKDYNRKQVVLTAWEVIVTIMAQRYLLVCSVMFADLGSARLHS